MGNRIGRASLALMLAGCCFGGGSGFPQPPPPVLPPPLPVDPSYDALWGCVDDTVVDNHCPAPLTTLTTDQFLIGLTYRTENLARFTQPGVLIGYVGNPAVEIVREPTGNTAGTPPAPPGETYTWNEYITLRCPDTGWPVGVPVSFELHDAAGGRVATTSITFVGPPLTPPPLHAQRILNVCSDRTAAGGDDDPYCPVNEETIPAGQGHLVASYTSGDPLMWVAGATMVLERRNRRGAFESESELSMDPVILPPGEDETFHTRYELDQPLFSRHSHWRVRFVVAGQTVSVREIDIE